MICFLFFMDYRSNLMREDLCIGERDVFLEKIELGRGKKGTGIFSRSAMLSSRCLRTLSSSRS